MIIILLVSYMLSTACLLACLLLSWPVKREFFLPTVAKLLAHRGSYEVGIFSVLL